MQMLEEGYVLFFLEFEPEPEASSVNIARLLYKQI
jgi:hypothetical protein